MVRRVLLMFLLLGVAGSYAAPAFAQGRAARERELVEHARRAHGAKALPAGYDLPGGRLTVTPVEQLAARHGATVRLTVRLDRPAAGAALLITRPEAFTRRAASGLRFAGAPRLGSDAGGEVDLSTDDATVVLDLGSAAAGGEASVSIDVGALSAGTYALPLRWRAADGSIRPAGTARIALYARSREEGEVLREAGKEAQRDPFTLRAESPAQATDSSNDGGEESETFLTVSPNDNQRVLSAGNRITAGAHDAFISGTGGRTFSPLDLPRGARDLLTLSTKTGTETSRACCDPMMAADDQGNLWFGGLTQCDPQTQAPSRIYVNRIAAGTNGFSGSTAGLPIKTTPATCVAPTTQDPDPANTIQDKPMMTIDNAPSSPTYGRLYVTWDDSDVGGGVNVVLSACDTRPGGTSQPARCDTGVNWSDPVVVSGPPGNYITSDPAVGPDGTVYVVWWDYSATNAIRMTRCQASCTTQPAWTAARPANVAVLDTTEGRPVPFACPINAQPGGRAAPVPSVDVDRSAGPNNGRIYVGWADLRPGSGTTKCDDRLLPTPPLPTHLTFDAFVAAGRSFTELTVPSTTVSASRGSRLIADTGSGPSDTNSDDFLSWVAVDQSNGDVWTDAYSTRNGPVTRTTTEFELASVRAPFTGTRPTIDNLRTVSTERSDYSDTPCCMFANDYGDYTGLDAAGDQPYPVWTDRQLGTDGDVFVLGMRDSPPSAPASTQPSPGTTTQASAPVPPPPPVVPPRVQARDRTPPVIRLGRRPTRLTRARTAALLVGPQSERIRGTLTLRTIRRLRRGSTTRTIVLGRASFSGAKGSRSRPRVRVSRTNAALLRRVGRIRVRATVVLVDAAGNRATRSVVFTLRPARRAR